MVFFKNIENYVKIYLSAESSHKWQVDRKMFSNIKSLMKISSEKFTRLAGWQVHRWEWGSSTREPPLPAQQCHPPMIIIIMVVQGMQRMMRATINLWEVLSQSCVIFSPSLPSRQNLKMSLVCLRACLILLLLASGVQPKPKSPREGKPYEIDLQTSLKCGETFQNAAMSFVCRVYILDGIS